MTAAVYGDGSKLPSYLTLNTKLTSFVSPLPTVTFTGTGGASLSDSCHAEIS